MLFSFEINLNSPFSQTPLSVDDSTNPESSLKDPPDVVDKKLSVSDNEVDEKEESLNKEENMHESTDMTSHEGNLHHNMAHSQMTIVIKFRNALNSFCLF